jgi:dTDP-4-amino-4,6-dideoxygalactose transaminase
MLRDHGQATKYYHNVEGYNGRLDAIQAGILSVKLKHLPQWNTKRREKAEEYKRLFAACDGGIQAPFEPSWSRAVYHLYVILTADRDGLMAYLKDAGIGAGIHYPIPLHLQRAYESLGYKKGSFPVTERVSEAIVSLPMFPQLVREQQKRVVENIILFLSVQAAPAIETLSIG